MPNSCHVIMDVISKMALYSPQGPLEIVKKQFLPHRAVSVLLFSRTLDLKFSVKCLKVNLIIDFERVRGAPRMAKKAILSHFQHFSPYVPACRRPINPTSTLID